MKKSTPLPPDPAPSASEPGSFRNLAVRALAVNGFWLMLPVLAINLAFAGALPASYQPERFRADIPAALAWTETISRMAVTVLPLLMSVHWRGPEARKGLWLYTLGIAAYGLAWAVLILLPDSLWSKSFIGFSAPAWLPAFWLAGIALATQSYWRPAKPAFVGASLLFIASHMAHVVLVFGRAG